MINNNSTLSFQRVTHDGRLEWRLDLLLPQSLEIDMPSKERMIPDILGAPDSESLGRVPVQ